MARLAWIVNSHLPRHENVIPAGTNSCYTHSCPNEQVTQVNKTQRATFAAQIESHIAEHYAALNHREDAAAFDLSGFQGKPAQTVHVTFGASGWLNHALQDSVLQPALDDAAEQGMPHAQLEQLADELSALQQETVSAFLTEKQAEGWNLTRRIGDVTVVFDEELADESHPANQLPDAALLVDEDGEPLPAVNQFSVNGRSFSTSEGVSLLQTCLPQLINWLATVQHVEHTEGEAFAPTISLDSRANASVIPDSRQLSLGTSFIANPDYDETARRFVLRHESGHAKNAAQEDIINAARDTLGFAFLPHALFETIRMEGVEATAAGLLSEFGDADYALGEIHALDETLADVAATIAPMREHLQQYPWIDTLDGMEMAADVENSTSFPHHMRSAPDITLSDDTAAHLNDMLDCIEEASDDEELDTDELQQVTDALSALLTKHASLKDDLLLMHDCYQYCSQAKEYLADLHAVQGMENPRDAKHYHEISIRNKTPDGVGEACHPKHQQRLDACGSFAERVLREREQAKHASHER